MEDRWQLQDEQGLIRRARESMAAFAADPGRWDKTPQYIGGLEYFVTELAAALEKRHADG